MIERFEYPIQELHPGDRYTVAVVGSEPITVQIKCFMSEPPPPGFRPCAECGSFKVRSGESLQLSVSATAFRKRSGAIDVVAEDSEGDTREVRLQVLKRDEERGTSMMSGGVA